MKSAAGRSATILPSFITTMRSEVDRISPRICEISSTEPPLATKLADIGHQLCGKRRIQRRGRLVEDHQPGLGSGIGKGHGDLDHLPLGDGEVADRIGAVDMVAREDLVELGPDDGERPAAPAPAFELAVHDAGIFGDRQIGAEGEFLEHAADAAGTRRSNARLPGPLPIAQAALMRIEPAIDDIDDGGFARTIMPDQPDAFARQDRQIDTIQRLDRAEMDLDPFGLNDRRFQQFLCHANVGCLR